SALVVMDRLHHPLEDGVEELPGLLGVAVGEQLHGVLQVGEEHGHLLSLAFEGGLRREDALREVRGRIRIRSSKARRSASLSRDRLRAFEAELRSRRKLRSAVGASKRELSGTFQAKLRLRRVLVLAPRTFQAGPPNEPGDVLPEARGNLSRSPRSGQ